MKAIHCKQKQSKCVAEVEAEGLTLGFVMAKKEEDPHALPFVASAYFILFLILFFVFVF